VLDALQRPWMAVSAMVGSLGWLAILGPRAAFFLVGPILGLATALGVGVCCSRLQRQLRPFTPRRIPALVNKRLTQDEHAS
jgi:hypothetical protein